MLKVPFSSVIINILIIYATERSIMEIWDLYDENRNKLNKTHARGITMEKNTYHLVVNIFITNEKGELLISQRHPQKTFPLQWEGCGGSVVRG